MPLETGKSKTAFSHNVAAERHAGKPEKQSLAIAYSKARGDSAESTMIRAAGVIFVSGDKALFVQRSPTSDHGGTWAFPGGTLEDGESAEEAARRECREEIGQMPKGTMAIHCRRISTVIPQPVSVDMLAPPVETEPQVDFTTFVMRVKDEFEPTLNEEHQGWAWAPISAPPQPMHPGAAAAIAKFTMNEYDIAVEIKDGRLTSPQQHMGNTWLFDMRITGTGMSFRTKHKEFVMRDPALYLNDYFLARCAGLEVIVEHPPDATLDTDEYRERIVGSIILPYIKGDEVWGIAKIRDAACAMMLTDPDRKDEYSTSPAVVFRKSDGNTAHIIDGQKILVEGPPSSLDHLAICRVGVWDKGGEPNGIVSTRGDSDVAKADEDMMSMMDAFRADMAKFADSMKDCSAKMDSATKRMDEEEEKKKADAAKRADAEKEEEKKKADAAKAKADANENGDDEDKKKADAKAKADAEEEDKKKADAAKKADAEKDEMDKKDDAARADALVANHPDFKAMREQLAALSAKMPAVISDADRGAFADAQARADVAYKAHGKDAPGPLMGETILSYRKRLAAGQKANSTRAAKLDVLAIADEGTLGVFEEMIYADSVAASRSTAGIPVGQLRERRSTSAAGHKIAEFDGDPGVWMSQFMGNTKATSTHSIRSRDPGRFN
jgi:8-oxo-dGTP pyrophosphatase MutT (NUDIX family)